MVYYTAGVSFVVSVRVSPSQLSAGRATRKYTKYSAVNNLLATTYGAAAAREPRNISVKKIPIKIQNRTLCANEYGANTSLVVVRLST
jgi:hypothetical protein